MLALGDGTRRTFAAIGAGGAALHSILMVGAAVIALTRNKPERVSSSLLLGAVLGLLAIALGKAASGRISPVTRVLFLIVAFFMALTMLAIGADAGDIDEARTALVWAAFVLSEAAITVGLTVLALTKSPPPVPRPAEYDGGWSDL